MIGVRESLLGPSYFYHCSLIRQSKGWSPSKIREYQDTRFQRLVRRYGDEITQKDDYQRYARRYARWNVPLLTHTVRTGGTSGQPLRFTADTFARRQKERAYIFDIWSQVGYQPYDLRVRYAGDIHGGMLRYNRLENVWIVSPGATVEGELSRLRQWIRTLPPFFLHVYPSSLYTFIDLVGEDLFRSLPVRGVIAASEMFPANDQARFEQAFGIKIAHWYGHSEYAVLAYCCRECRSFHFYPTYGCVELLSSEIERYRRIVASSFNRIGTQFVRYDTGDLAVDPLGSCANDNFPRASAIVGRSQETFVDNSGRPRSLYGYAFGDLDHGAFYDQIRDIQFVQDKAGSLRVRIVTNQGAERDQIQQTFERRIPMARLEFEYVSVIERSPSGKRRYFVDASNKDAIGSNDHLTTSVMNGTVAAEVERQSESFTAAGLKAEPVLGAESVDDRAGLGRNWDGS
jgi:phenylacetate-coenzyme A ligase PaaK-like adenylate-forming protein